MTNLLRPGQKLWFQHKRPQDAIRSFGSYSAVQHMNVMLIGDALDRRAEKALITFPDQGLCYVMDASQLKAVIAKLQDTYSQITGRGQKKVISFNNDRQDWQE